LANERFFSAEIARGYGANWSSGAKWVKRSADADTDKRNETKYFNETLAGGKWRHLMSPEMGPGQWPSMRIDPPNPILTDFSSAVRNVETFNLPDDQNDLLDAKESKTLFSDRNGVVSIEAEHFLRSTTVDNFSWRVIKGLGKTGNSVSVFPARAHSFTNKSAPSLEYQIDIEKAGEFDAWFNFIPTQPLLPGHGLRIAFSIDDGDPQIVMVDSETEVSSRKWAQNILDETTIGSAKVKLTSGRHKLSIIAVDTGVVLDKIVLASGTVPKSYLGPDETRFERFKQ